METLIGILLIIMAVFLVVSVLMQSSKNHRLSGTIAGGAETFFGKQKGRSIDAILSKVTTVVAIVFVVLVVVFYVMVSNPSPAGDNEEISNSLEENEVVDGNEDNENDAIDTNTDINDDADANSETDANSDAEAKADAE